MKLVHEVNCDSDILDLTKYDIQVAMAMGKRIIWNFKGMRGLIPPDILEAELRLYEECRLRIRQYDKLPERVGKVIWAQTTRLPEDDSRDPDQICIKT